MIKFVAFYAILALVLSAYVEWEGGDPETDPALAPWVAFTNTLGGGPGAWMPGFPAAPGSEVTTQPPPPDWITRDLYYVNHTGGLCADRYSLSEHPPAALTEWNINSDYPNPTAPTYFDTEFNSTGGNYHLQFRDGEWKFSIYYARRVNITIDVLFYNMTFSLWTLDSSCVRVQTIWEVAANLSTYMAVEYRFDYSTNRSLPVDIPVDGGIILSLAMFGVWTSDGHWNDDMNDIFPLSFYTSPEDKSFITAPSSKAMAPPVAVADCDWFCQIGNALAWIAWIFLVIGWVILAIIITIAWFFYTVVLFFTALFSLSFSGIFGPFGVVVGILTTVFLAYLILTLIYLVRGSEAT